VLIFGLPKTKIGKLKRYPYKAVAIIDRENKVDIGLISPASVEAYGNRLEILQGDRQGTNITFVSDGYKRMLMM